MTEAERAAIRAAARRDDAANPAPPIRPEIADRLALLLRGTPTTRPQAVTGDGEPQAVAS